MSQELKLKIDGMHCPSCAKLIEGILLDNPAVSSAQVDDQSGTGSLIADLDQVSIDQLLGELSKEGYPSQVISQSTQGEDSPITVKEKIVPAGSPLGVRLNSNIQFDGTVAEGEDGKPIFKGSITEGKVAEISVPEKDEKTHNFIDHVIKSLGAWNLLSWVEHNGSHLETEGPAPEPKVEDEEREKPSGERRVGLSLSGMHCASCAGLIERSLNKAAGVKQAGVNFAAEKAYVTFDAAVVSPDGLIEAVKRAGYKAELVDERDSEYESRKREREMAGYFNKFLFSLAFSLPMLYFMLLDFFKWLPGANSMPPLFRNRFLAPGHAGAIHSRCRIL